MTLSGSFEIVLTLAFTIAAAYPIGSYMADVFENRRTFLAQIIGPIERAFYRLAGVKPNIEQKWHEYAIAMVLFSGACMFGLYALLRLQAYLPLNPQSFPGVPPDLAFNIAISFITNANWQAYGGETTLSHLSQMVGLTANNFLDSAAATAIAVALIRALSRNEWTTIGNFWVDITRATLYILLPLALVVALGFAALGVPQTLSASIQATTLEGAKQVMSIGPAFVDIDPASIPHDIGINLVAPLHIIHTAASWMRSPGAIVNTISLASITPLAGSSVYSATKFALRGFNIALHMEMKPRGITVSGVLPGTIDTPMLLKETREGATALNFLGDPLPPAKVAKVILRAAKEGKVEYYIPYSERILSSFALLFPALIPTIYPCFEKMGVKRQKAYLASRAKDTLPEGTPIPERERAEAL